MPTRFLSPAHYRAYGQYNGSPGDVQLNRFFYLNDFDHEHIQRRRRSVNRLGFALQLVTVRFLGTYVQDLTAVPPAVQNYVAQQIGAEAVVEALAAYQRSETFWNHQMAIAQIYGYRSFHDEQVGFSFLRWLYTRTWIGSERPSVLFDLSTAWLIEHKILLPGVTVLERCVAQVRERAEQRSWHVLNAQIDHEQRDHIAQLLASTEDGLPPFEMLRRPPTHVSSPQIRQTLDRLEQIHRFALHTTDVSRLSVNRLRTLADYALNASISTLRRLRADRQTAVLLAGMVALATRTQDLCLDMFEQWMQESTTQARQTLEQQRLQSLAQFDQAAFYLRDLAQFILDKPTEQLIDLQHVFDHFQRDQVAASINIIDEVRHPEKDSHRALLVARYRSARRFLPALLRLITFQSIALESDVLNAITFLHQLDTGAMTALQDAPRGVISTAWRSLVYNQDGEIQQEAYTFCVLQELLRQLRRRDVYVMPSDRWHDPRQFLIDETTWSRVKPQICRILDREPTPENELSSLSQQLDEAYHQTGAALVDDPNLRLEMLDGRQRPVITPLDRLPDTLDGQVAQQVLTQRLPAVDLPDLLLEVHQMTRFADAFIHISERQSRVQALPISLCAVLLAQGCNIGLEAVADETFPALTLERLRWIQQNYVRPDTLIEANEWLVRAQSRLRLAQRWGGGEVASADGLRFVVPSRALHGGLNRKYFGTGRGITFFNFMSNQFTGFHHIVIPGTLREALYILDGLLDQTTELQPTEIMTDTNSYTDVVFGLFWLLGFQFSPRLADIKDRRFWRMNRQADYGAFNDIARHQISVQRVQADWDDLLRVAGSLKTGRIAASQLMRIFSTSGGTSSLTRSIRDVGRIAKTLYMLHYLRDEAYRRRILTQLNHGELRHKLARRLFYGNRGVLKQPYRQGQEAQLGALGLLLNIVVYWNTVYLDHALTEWLQHHPNLNDDDLDRITPLAFDHIRVLGRYTFRLHPAVQAGQLRPLKPLSL